MIHCASEVWIDKSDKSSDPWRSFGTSYVVLAFKLWSSSISSSFSSFKIRNESLFCFEQAFWRARGSGDGRFFAVRRYNANLNSLVPALGIAELHHKAASCVQKSVHHLKAPSCADLQMVNIGMRVLSKPNQGRLSDIYKVSSQISEVPNMFFNFIMCSYISLKPHGVVKVRVCG